MKTNETNFENDQFQSEVPPRESVILYKRFYEVIRLLPKRDQRRAYEVIFQYAFYDELPGNDTSKGVRQLFLLVQPQFDANERKRKAKFCSKSRDAKKDVLVPEE
ncbi:MAG: DUF6291 domain-containing protein [Alistipes sp.]|nr:DUF6291 domain-containing protein [Alistipes sp.]